MSAKAPTYCAYVSLLCVLLWDFSTMIAGVTLIPEAASCVGGGVSVSLPTWIFVNGLAGFISTLFVISFYAAPICMCPSEGGLCLQIPNFLKSSLFWLVISLPLLFRLGWVVIGVILVASTSSNCPLYSALIGVTVTDLIFFSFSVVATVKLACTEAINPSFD